LTFVNKDDYDRVREDDRISVTGVTAIRPGSMLTVTLRHSDGKVEQFSAQHTYNEQQIDWFKAGSALNVRKN
jgi:aconitate hydratase